MGAALAEQGYGGQLCLHGACVPTRRLPETTPPPLPIQHPSQTPVGYAVGPHDLDCALDGPTQGGPGKLFQGQILWCGTGLPPSCLLLMRKKSCQGIF